VFQLAGEELARRDVPYEVLLRGGPQGAELRRAQEYRVARAEADSRSDPWQLQQRLLGSEVASELGAGLSVTATPAGAGLQRAVLAASVPTKGTGMPSSVWIQAVALDSRAASFSTPAIHDLWTQVIDLAGESPPPSEVVVFGDLLAPCEGARLRVRLLADGGGEELTGLELPPCGAPALEAIPIRRLDAAALVTHEPGFDPGDASTNPLALDDRAFLPAAQPVVTAEGSLSLLIRVGEWSDAARLEAELLDPRGQLVRAASLQGERLQRTGTAARFLTAFPLEGLAAGSYRLWLRWLEPEERGGEHRAHVDIEVP
jgi:hypothetical protein